MIGLLLAPALALAEPFQPVSVAVALGGSFVAGSTVPVSPGLSSGFLLGISMSRRSVLELGTAHADHAITDARGFFPDTDVPAEAVSGGRRYWSPRVVTRFGFRMPMVQEEPYLRAWPILRLGLGVSYTITRLDVPAFTGPTRMESHAWGPLVLLGAGAEVRIGEHLSLIPHFDLEGTGYQNGDEATGEKETGLEWRGNPALMVAARF